MLWVRAILLMEMTRNLAVGTPHAFSREQMLILPDPKIGSVDSANRISSLPGAKGSSTNPIFTAGSCAMHVTTKPGWSATAATAEWHLDQPPQNA